MKATALRLYGASDLRLEPIELAPAGEVHAGAAYLLTTLSGTAPQRYAVEIEKIRVGGDQTRNFIVHVTDPRLLAAAGGILQGMSGSPILQDGKLAGALTHVFVNDPTRGYGIFAETMRRDAEAAA